MTITMTNNEIYAIAQNLIAQFSDSTQKFPIKVNFYLQKNKIKLIDMARDIEASRLEIITEYGTLSEENDGQYIIASDKVEIAQKELNDLFALAQDVQIYKVSIDDFPQDAILTAGQMEALMFMID